MEASPITETCSTRDAAKALGISVRTAQMWVEEGRLRAWKTPGGHRRILRESVDAILRKRQQETAGTPEDFDILVVEDDRIQRQLIESTLQDLRPGLDVRAAYNGMEGLIKIGERQPQLLITDLVMPGIDGFHMLATLTSTPLLKPMQIIAVTGLSDTEITAKGGLPAGVAIFHKPLNMPALTNLVQAYHDLWSLGRQSAR